MSTLTKLLVAVVAVLVVSGCADAPLQSYSSEVCLDEDAELCFDRLPLCADLGCQFAPSGDPVVWTQCVVAPCWCGSPLRQCRIA